MSYKYERGLMGNLKDYMGETDKLQSRANATESRLFSNEEVNNITFVALAETKVLDDDTAARHAEVFPLWAEKVDYKDGNMRVDPLNGKLYRVRDGKAHTSSVGWNPSIMADSWVLVDVTHAGTMDDPIPAGRGMEFVYGLYYFDEEVSKLYLCKRTGEAEGGTVILQFMPHELVGQYFEEITK